METMKTTHSLGSKDFLKTLRKTLEEEGDFDFEVVDDVIVLTSKTGVRTKLVAYELEVPAKPRPRPKKIRWSPRPSGTVLHLYDPRRPARRSVTGTGLNPLCVHANHWGGTLHHANLLGRFKKRHGHEWRRRCKTCEKKAIKLGIPLEGRDH